MNQFHIFCKLIAHVCALQTGLLYLQKMCVSASLTANERLHWTGIL